jgi:putative restriction endonuclease
MVKGIFTTKAEPGYDDLPEIRYHFPKAYLRQASQCIGDWIVYYEPRRSSTDLSSRGGRQAYFATARVLDIQADPSSPDHYYAFVGDFLPFSRPVPFREADFFYENALRRGDGATNKGAFGRAVRNISDREYDLIFQSGYATILSEEKQPDDRNELGLQEEAAEFERPLVESLIRRPFRDAAFANAVKDAYQGACAVTGIRIVNGGGRTEVQAAHIRPVADNGPDSVRNGIALSSTIHWMFDRGLLSVDDDYSLLLAADSVPDTVRRLLRPDGRLATPNRTELRPHPSFLNYHRQHVFKG